MKKRYKTILISVIPFLLLLGVYSYFSIQRHIENPYDRLLPSITQLYEGFIRAMTPGAMGRENYAVFWNDTLASLQRLTFGVLISGIISLSLSLSMHLFVTINHLFKPLMITMAKIPPLALLPILLLWVGINEFSKISLIMLGIAPLLTLELYNKLEHSSKNLQNKLELLKMPIWQQLFFIKLPILWPTFLQQMQLFLGPAWLFLLAAETIGTNQGLGYRIYVVRRFLSMDIIIVYVIWISILSIAIYSLIGLWLKRFQWYFYDRTST